MLLVPAPTIRVQIATVGEVSCLEQLLSEFCVHVTVTQLIRAVPCHEQVGLGEFGPGANPFLGISLWERQYFDIPWLKG